MTLQDLARYLPTREEISRIASARARYTGSDIVGALGLGALVGAAIALLYAPKTGRELRDDISRRVEDLRETTRGAGHNGGTGRYSREAE
jgi:hypothetical protein